MGDVSLQHGRTSLQGSRGPWFLVTTRWILDGYIGFVLEQGSRFDAPFFSLTQKFDRNKCMHADEFENKIINVDEIEVSS